MFYDGIIKKVIWKFLASTGTELHQKPDKNYKAMEDYNIIVLFNYLLVKSYDNLLDM